MSEPTYTLTLSESERTALAKALGMLTTKLINAPIFVESPTGGTAAARAVLGPSQDSPTPPSGHAPPSLLEPRDRWASDRKIKAPQDAGIFWAQNGAVAREITIWKTEQKPGKKNAAKQFLKVTWQSHDRGYVDANCFDQQLFPWLINSQGKKATLYLVKSGEYLNVVGVRA